MDKEQMPKVDINNDPNISEYNRILMKRLEEQNVARAHKLKQYRSHNRILSVSLGLMVIGIYSYTMYAVKQEKFLDDFDEPEKIIEKPEE